MRTLQCRAEDCVYNADEHCSAHAIMVSNTEDETFCDTYTKKDSFVAAAHIPADAEFGEELAASPRITCNVTQCAFNKSFRCRANSVEIDDPHDVMICNCNTYRPK